MGLILTTGFVTVHDPELALTFYRDTLGLEVRNDVPNGEYRWITVGAPGQPGVSLVLSNYINGSPADIEALQAMMAKGALIAAHFQADDLDATFAQVQAAGAEVVQEPADQPWGARDFAVRDPSGNLVRIDQAPRG